MSEKSGPPFIKEMMEGIYELKMYFAFGWPIETPSLGSKNFRITSFDSQKKKKERRKIKLCDTLGTGSKL